MRPSSETNGYDVVGDIHGHAGALHRLLDKMGYTKTAGVYRHTSRRVIFVGDFVDRGPEQTQVLQVARAMLEANTAKAVLGNHEFNAVGWATSDGNGGYLRSHSEANTNQHREFLRQIGDGSSAYHEAISWFRQLPVWLELPGLRVVHACWHEPSCKALVSHLDEQKRFTKSGFVEALRKGSPAYSAAEILMKGPEQRLPSGMYFFDKEGHRREEVRLQWWNRDATTFRKAAIGIEEQRENIPDEPLPIDFIYRDEIPVLFGHYWLKGKPKLTALTAACLDFSVAKSGYLTAYRWSGESRLTDAHFEYVCASEA